MSNARTLASLIDTNNKIQVPSGGIAFTDLDSSNDSATASEAYVLGQDGYEEGIWTPVLSSSGTAPTVSSYTPQSGKYTKLGNIVTVTCYLRATLSATGTGYPIITGLPFSAWSYSGVALGISNLLNDGQSSDNYVIGSEVRLYHTTYKTSANNYITFQLTYTES